MEECNLPGLDGSQGPSTLPVIIVQLVPVPGTGLEYYNILFVQLNPYTDQIVKGQRLDSHWQEQTAWECAERWSKRYRVEIYRLPITGEF